MGHITKVCYVFQVIFLQIIFLTMSNAEYRAHSNNSNHDSPLLAERSRRAPFHRYIPPDILLATIKDGSCKEIHLTWKRVNRFLFNENLPVYTVRKQSWGPTHKKSNIMKEKVGKKILYHDIKQKSSLMYSENTDSFSGVVGQSYAIIQLPLDGFSQPLIVGGPYVRRMPHHLLHGEKKNKNHEFTELSDVVNIDTEDITADSLRDSQDPPTPFYVETLVLVSYDIFKFAQSQFRDDALASVLQNILLHFNAVDMVYNTLPKDDFEIFINLAGIIVEEEDGVFSEILNYPPLKYENQPTLFNDGRLISLLEQYPKHFDFPFPRDSFDLILFTTGRMMVLNGVTLYYGLNSIVRDIFWDKRADNRAPSVPVISVQLRSQYSEYPVVVHHLAFKLGIYKYDDCSKGIIAENGQQCYTLLQNLNPHCTNCILWSKEAVDQMTAFFMTNRNRCFLLNKPRSLHPPGTKIISLSPCGQCTCFGYISYGEETPQECPLFIPAKRCGEPLQCKYSDYMNEEMIELTILPLDGTPCGENKVCWDEECKSIS